MVLLAFNTFWFWFITFCNSDNTAMNALKIKIDIGVFCTRVL